MAEGQQDVPRTLERAFTLLAQANHHFECRFLHGHPTAEEWAGHRAACTERQSDAVRFLNEGYLLVKEAVDRARAEAAAGQREAALLVHPEPCDVTCCDYQNRAHIHPATPPAGADE